MTTFNDWVQMRLSIEDIVPITGPFAGGVVQSLLSATSQDRALVAADKTQQRGTPSPYLTLVQRPGETDRDFQKRKNATYVRRNYHRQRLSTLILEGEAQKFARLNSILKAENQRLQDLIAQAEALLSDLDQKPPAYTTSNEEVVEMTNAPGGDDDDDAIDDASSSFASVLLDASDADIEVVEEEEEDTQA